WGTTLALWEVSTGRQLYREGGVGDFLAFSPDGRSIGVGSQGQPVTVYRLGARRPRPRLLHLGPQGYGGAFAARGKALALATDGAIVLWDLPGHCELRELKGHRGIVRSVACSADGKHLASGGADGTVRLWDMKTGKQCWGVRRGEEVHSVAFSPD